MSEVSICINSSYGCIKVWSSEYSQSIFIQFLLDYPLENDRIETQDAIGDIVVVLTNLAHLQQMKIEDCVASAYDQIKNRKGSMVNGTFVKQEAPKKPWGHQSVTL